MNLFWCRKGFSIHPGTSFLTKVLKEPFLNYAGKNAKIHQATNSHNSFNQTNQTIILGTICGFYLLLLNLILLDWKETDPLKVPPLSPALSHSPWAFPGFPTLCWSSNAKHGWCNGCVFFSKAVVPGANDM